MGKLDAPPPDAAAPPVDPPTDERLLEVLAELDLVRRNASSLEARLRRWEERLDDACRVVDDLLGAEGERRDPVEALDALERRVERLDRRRAPPVVEPQPTLPDTAPPGPVPPPLDLPEAVAIVRARWLVDAQPVEAAAEVELSAEVDGIPEGEPVTVEIMPLGGHTAVETLTALSDGDRVHATWRVPSESDERAWWFLVRHGAAESVSPPLHVA